MTQIIKGTLYNAFVNERMPDCTGETCIYRVSIQLLAPSVDSECWNNMKTIEYGTYESIPFYTADYQLPFLNPDISYCYSCSHYLAAYADVKLDENGIRYSTGVKRVHIEEDCDITEDFFIPVSVPAPVGCDKLFVSNYGMLMPEVAGVGSEKAELIVQEGDEVRKYVEG